MGLTLALALVAGVSLGQVPRKHEIEAQVNGKVITTYEVYKQVRGRWTEMERQAVPNLPEAKRQAWRQARRELIENLLLVQAGQKLAKEHPVIKGFINRRVQIKIEELRRESGGEGKLRDFVEQKEKITYDEYLKRLRENELRSMIIARGILKGYRIRLSAIEDYYRENPSKFDTPARVRFRQIRLSMPSGGTVADREELTAVAKELIKRIRKGADFGAVAKDLVPRTEEAGKEAPLRNLPELSPPIREALRRLKPGGVSDPVWTGSTVRIVKLIELKPGRRVPFSEAQTAIRRRLEMQAREGKYYILMESLRKKSYVWERKDAAASLLDRRLGSRIP